VGIDLVTNRATREPCPEIVPRILNAMRDEGVLIGSEGVHGNILKLRPPLVLSADEADLAVDALDRCLAACAP